MTEKQYKFAVGQKVEILIGTYTGCIGVVDSICMDYDHFPYNVLVGQNHPFIAQYSEEELQYCV